MSSTGYYQYNMRTVVHSAPGSIIRVPALFKGMQARRVVLFSEEGSRQTGLVDQLISLFDAGGSVPKLAGVFADIPPVANCETVNVALRFTREVAADAILAVGGSGVPDVSKGVKYALHHQFTDIREGLQTRMNMDSWPNATDMKIPHIAVATTAGSGVEVSLAARFFNEDLEGHCNLINPFLGPDMVVLDANLTLGSSPHLTATTGMAALAHALEAVASPLANHLSDAHAFRAAQLIVENLPLAVNNGKDVQARTNLLQAGIMAQNAFCASRNTTPIHECANAFSAFCAVSQGEANAVLLPVCIEAFSDFYLPNVSRLAVALNLQAKGKEDNVLLADIVACLRSLQDVIGIDRTPAHWRVTPDNTEKIITAVMSSPTRFIYQIHTDKIAEIIRHVVD